MNIRRSIVAGAMTAAILGGAGALAPAAQAGTTAQPATQQSGDVSITASCGYYGGKALTMRGHTGKRVKEVQCLINKLWQGGNPLKVDSIFGPETERWVKKFQRDHGLAADGKVGKNTWAMFRAY
ncbi:peptidoglycan-binding domain-containing protein [Streptomyces gobiensis]|uniref:peptidoglycan-binding domain-containing protein n=1 Tax=Streptomyces gobiensis TaxID=2875706 RepID=UPI001E5696F8|nr:peptidoglycan-binding domain-containing protein [Streptomyces gobiensis]UGY93223.1 peptidoglycan-binding protein [Streptomyces gobiensis]